MMAALAHDLSENGQASTHPTHFPSFAIDGQNATSSGYQRNRRSGEKLKF